MKEKNQQTKTTENRKDIIDTLKDKKEEIQNAVQNNHLTTEKSVQPSENFIKYITSLYQNVATALQSIEELMPKVEDNEQLKKELSNQYTNYDIIARECEMIAKSEKIELKENNWFEKLRLWSSINLTTIMDKSQRHIAEMMLLGTVMGLIQCLKDIKDYEGISEELDDICSKISELEECNYQRLKEFI